MRAPKSLLVLFLALLVSPCGSAADRYEPHNGDIIFHTSVSAQSEAIQRATGSRYSHVGIVYLRVDGPYVFEAIEPVSSTPLSRWIARGKDGHFVVKRLADADSLLTDAALARMLEVGQQLDGKHYDFWFEWSDERLYCSELVWKIYQRALGIELGKIERLRDFDLADPLVYAKLRERYGDSIPMDEPVISPAALLAAPALVTVHQG